MDKEIWKDIKGYENLYQISNLGRVKSLPKYHKKNESIMKYTLRSGYRTLVLRKNSKRKSKQIHRLVAEAFIPKNGEDKVCVNHKNGNKLDNRVENLEWVSYSENLKHSYDVLNRPVNRTTIKYRNVICTFPNDEVVEVKSIDEASRLTGVSSTQIRRLHGNGKKSRNGYSFYIPSLNVEDSERIVI